MVLLYLKLVNVLIGLLSYIGPRLRRMRRQNEIPSVTEHELGPGDLPCPSPI